MAGAAAALLGLVVFVAGLRLRAARTVVPA
jgi:hypothetical protein